MSPSSRLLLVVLPLVFLASCAGVPLKSLWQLRNVDPLEADPKQVRLAVVTNHAVYLRDKSTSLTLSFSSQNSEHDFSQKIYASIENKATVPSLEKFIKADEHITVFYLDEQAAYSMRLAQQRISAIKADQIMGEGRLAIEINTGCFVGKKPNNIVADIYVRFSVDRGYLALQSDVDLLTEIEKEDSEFWLECPEGIK